MESILPALITGGLALIGVVITNISSNKKIENQLVTAQAVTDLKIDTLAEEVKKHNNFASRVPLLEQEVKGLNRRVDQLDRRKDNVE